MDSNQFRMREHGTNQEENIASNREPNNDQENLPDNGQGRRRGQQSGQRGRRGRGRSQGRGQESRQERQQGRSHEHGHGRGQEPSPRSAEERGHGRDQELTPPGRAVERAIERYEQEHGHDIRRGQERDYGHVQANDQGRGQQQEHGRDQEGGQEHSRHREQRQRTFSRTFSRGRSHEHGHGRDQEPSPRRAEERGHGRGQEPRQGRQQGRGQEPKNDQENLPDNEQGRRRGQQGGQRGRRGRGHSQGHWRSQGLEQGYRQERGQRTGQGRGQEPGQGHQRGRAQERGHGRGQELTPPGRGEERGHGRGYERGQEHRQGRYEQEHGHDIRRGQERDYGHVQANDQGRGQQREHGRGQEFGQEHSRHREQRQRKDRGQEHNQARDQGNVENHQGRPRARPRARPIRQPGYKMLESLLDANKSLADVVHELSSFDKGLESLLNEPNIRRDLMDLLIQVMAKICNCESAPQSVVRVLNIILDTNFLRNLSKFLTDMMTESDDEYLARAPDQITSILQLMKTLLERLQSSKKDVTVVLGVVKLVAGPLCLEAKGYPLDGNTAVLLEQLLSCCIKADKDKTKTNHHQRRDPEVPPPNNFRGIPIVPRVEEINTTAESYLRANMVRGKYRDLDHYLDVQFRLLRQDFLEPLKVGIQEYHTALAEEKMNHNGGAKRKDKFKDINIYLDVRVHFPICSNEGITHRVSFDNTKFHKISWKATKRLTFGSLVCLSKDNFQSLIFATVANRKPEELEHGLVDLRFQDMNQVSGIESSESFIMAESPAFFEAYRYVLQGLKEVRENTLPLQRYIIEVSKDIHPPQYFANNRNVTYDLSPLTNLDTPLRGPLKHTNANVEKVYVLKSSSWPEAESLDLNESQLEAVQTALTQELVLIQGPPGTGKTYIGLRIVQALLHNSGVWKGRREITTILVVCYTNHALDQFLEGIMDFNKNIVRVGGRSKSEYMTKKNLNFLKRKQRLNKSVPRGVHERTGKVYHKMQSMRRVMEVHQTKVERTTTGIIGEDYLQRFMKGKHYDSLTFKSGKSRFFSSTSYIMEWLGLSGTGQEEGIAMSGGVDYEDKEEEDENELHVEEENEDEFDTDVEEEADVIEEQRFLDDEQEYPFRFDDEISVESHLVLDTDLIGANNNGWKIQAGSKKRMKEKILRNLRKADRMSETDIERIDNVWALDIQSRWQLYRYWVNEYCNIEKGKMVDMQEKYESLSQELRKIRVEEDLTILRQADVIGMTTTGAAKHRNVLERVGPRIIVVEEAAEVLESHIITTLSVHCQHLILIGDHQQLKPKTTVYRLAKNFDLDISLFERMIRNGLPCQTLVKQHRMRHEISTIMKNHFYPHLQDDESVRSYPNVSGISANVFFLNHTEKEDVLKKKDSKSKSNLHEAEVLVGLCKYLIQQGQYQPTQITILTAYVGQLLNFKRLMKKSNIFKGVHVCSVDSFQGEENDIILLSLVRSNNRGNIGFLKIPNRMCVALSRARHGFFCIGNFQDLAHGSSLWRDIVRETKEKGMLGGCLELVCRNHPQKVLQISTGRDFRNAPDGGCNQPCKFRLDCGHSCTMSCHPTDPEHIEFRCWKPCVKVLKCGHKCSLPCSTPCGNCRQSVDKILPCGHKNSVPCFLKHEKATCREPCANRLPCRHMCQKYCGEKPCTSVCQEITLRSDWPCGHVVSVKCSDGPENCPQKCRVPLECSHTCPGTCGLCKGGRLHVQCRQKCNRILVCDHECVALCTRDCPPCTKKCENRCVHSKCPYRCGYPCTSCQEPCPWHCPHYKCSKKCSEACDRPPCDTPCAKFLKCGHPCIGLCGEPCPQKCRVCHKDEVTEIFFGSEDEPDARFVQLEDCGHVFEAAGLDYWMRIETEEQTSILLKACPKCKTTIRRNRRYGSAINATLTDIEVVKARIFGDEKQRAAKREELLHKLPTMRNVDCIKERIQSARASLVELSAIDNQLNLLTAVQKAQKDAYSRDSQMQGCRRELSELKQWLLKPLMYLSHQELEECSREVQRLSLCIELYHIKPKLPNTSRNKTNLGVLEKLLLSGKPLLEDSRDQAMRLLKKLRPQCSGLGISDAERVMIVKAIGLSQGHWYKCPNGHCYAIADCGGATVESTCPECEAKIGGMHHRLLANNAVATEMDGARYGAWSEQANMANYVM